MSRTSTGSVSRVAVSRIAAPRVCVRIADAPRDRSRWRPLLRGDEARRVHRVVERLLEAPRVQGASLATGEAGVAIALTELALARDDDRAAIAARDRMDRAIEAMARDRMSPWLFDGFAGVAWAADHLFGEGAAEVDAAVAHTLRRAAAVHELYGGVAGLGLYALARPRAGLAGALARLRRLAMRDGDGIAWETPLSLLPPGAVPPGAHRHFNLGLAHGLPGVIGMLALAHDGRAGRAGARGGRGSRSSAAVSGELLDGAVRWLFAHRMPDGADSWFPGWVDPGAALVPSRQGWCYGDAAIARVLWLAARAADEPAWRRVALDVARRAAGRPLPPVGALDAGLCHGSAGLGHIFNHHWQATGERVFADAARRWFRLALARLDHLSGDGLLSGRSGVALGLLHAVTPYAPTWDRVLLLS